MVKMDMQKQIRSTLSDPLQNM